MLEGAKGSWTDDLPGVLWSIRTTVKEATRQSPFALVYGSDVVLPVEVGIPSPQITFYDQQRNDELKSVSLDLLPEVRGDAFLRSIAYKNRIARYYNNRVRSRPLAEGDWVLRNEATGRNPNLGKLNPNWEGLTKLSKSSAPAHIVLRQLKEKSYPVPGMPTTSGSSMFNSIITMMF